MQDLVAKDSVETNGVEYTHGLCVDKKIVVVRIYDENKKNKLKKDLCYLLRGVKVHRKFLTINNSSKVV